MPSFAAIQAELEAMLSIPDEELTDEQEALLDSYLDELGQQEADKIDSFAQFLKVEGARAEAIKAEGKRLMSKAGSIENRLAYLKASYLGIMRSHGLKKIAGAVYTVSVRETPVVEVRDMVIVPEEFLRTETTVRVDKVAIKAALKEGKDVPGCALAPSYSLQMR